MKVIENQENFYQLSLNLEWLFYFFLYILNKINFLLVIIY